MNFEELIEEIADHFWVAALEYAEGLEFEDSKNVMRFGACLKKYKKMKGFK